MQKHVPYYRVSTDRQGRSGLGLEAQQTAVDGYLSRVGGEILTTFTEIESGKKVDRPEILKAITLCKQQKARLVIAKLDRLARNVYFIAGLMESGVDFVACDMPEANKTMLHIWAAMAEWERDQISKRTKEALAAVKVRGIKLGNPRPAESLERGRATVQANLFAYRERHLVLPRITTLRQRGLSLREIARLLNEEGTPTPRDRQWEASSVRNYLRYERAEASQER